MRRPSSPEFPSTSGFLLCICGAGIRGGRALTSFQGPSLESGSSPLAFNV